MPAWSLEDTQAGRLARLRSAPRREEVPLLHAVGSGEHPLVGDQRASAPKVAKVVEADLPRPASWRGGHAPHDPAIGHRNATP